MMGLAGAFQGVQADILREQPLAVLVYTHCVAYALNVVLVDSFDESFVRDGMSTVNSIINFSRLSVQRNEVFKSQLEDDAIYSR